MDSVMTEDLIYTPKSGLYKVVDILSRQDDVVTAIVTDGITKQSWTFSMNNILRFAEAWYLTEKPRIRGI